MEIVDLRVHLVAPMGTHELVEGSRLGWVFVEIEAEDGQVGVGECSNWPRKGDVLVGHALRTVRDRVIGMDAGHIERIWQRLFRDHTYLGSRGLVTTVISGIDIALWDLKGKHLGRPVWDLLGGPVRDAIPLYTHPEAGAPSECAASAVELVGEGYEALKIDPFREFRDRLTGYLGGTLSRRGLREGVETVQTVREAVGPDVEIMIDLRGNANVASAVEIIAALEPYDITWFEEPVPPESVAALAQVRAQTDANLCVGERLYTRFDVLPILEAGLVNHVMPDVCWTGGISELRRIAALAEAHYVPISPHNALGPVQIVAGAHVARTVPNLHRLEINSLWKDRYDAAVSHDLDIRDGTLHLSDRPGLGIELDREFLASHPDPDWPSSV